jgi:hypothetical protein
MAEEVDYETWVPDPQILAVVKRKMEEVKPFLLEKNNVPDFIDGAPRRDHIVYNGIQDYEGTAMLRLDWELEVDEVKTMAEESRKEYIVDLMIEQMTLDLADLLENGNKTHPEHPLLGALDGKKKVSKELSDITLGDIALYKEYVPKKKSVEYTVYTRVGPVWA